jgi:hypothetical protein
LVHIRFQLIFVFVNHFFTHWLVWIFDEFMTIL